MAMESDHRADPSVARRAAWRWHFYAAWFVLPVLLVLAVTGLVILLKPTIERIAYGDLLYVDRPSSVESLVRQVDAVTSAYPGAIAVSVVPPRDPGRSTQVDVLDSRDRSLSVYVDPGSARVLGHIDNATRIDYVATQIHGTLWMGRWGDYLVEMVAGWTVVMVLTGIYLWYPRTGTLVQRVRRALVPRARHRGRRRIRDVHATIGAVFAPLLVVLVLTGLPWSGFWGEEVWSRVVDGFDAGVHVPDEEPTSVPPSAAVNRETAGLQIAWASERTSPPRSSPVGAPLGLDAVERRAGQVGMLPGYAIGLPADEIGAFVLSNPWPSRAQDERTIWLDQYSGELLLDSGWSTTYGVLARATSVGVEAHMGRQFGWPGALIMAGTCAAAIVSVLSAPMMFWMRRPRGATGFPRRPVDASLPRGARVAAIALGVLFPLLGLSMLVAIGIDRWFIREVPEVRRLFGMRDGAGEEA